MALPLHPAAYARHAADRPALTEAAVCRGWPVPVVYADEACGGEAPALGRLVAAVSRGCHDGLLVPLPGTLGEEPRLIALLQSCTRHGVEVSFVPASRGWPLPGWPRRSAGTP